jgi:hypothetical protein
LDFILQPLFLAEESALDRRVVEKKRRGGSQIKPNATSDPRCTKKSKVVESRGPL